MLFHTARQLMGTRNLTASLQPTVNSSLGNYKRIHISMWHYLISPLTLTAPLQPPVSRCLGKYNIPIWHHLICLLTLTAPLQPPVSRCLRDVCKCMSTEHHAICPLTLTAPLQPPVSRCLPQGSRLKPMRWLVLLVSRCRRCKQGNCFFHSDLVII